MTKEEILDIYRTRRDILQDQINRGKPLLGGVKTIEGWKQLVKEAEHIIRCVETGNYTLKPRGKLRVPVTV